MSAEFCTDCGTHWDQHVVDLSGSYSCPVLPKALRMWAMATNGVKPKSKADVLREIIDEVHSWIVCSAITTPEDMMQNAERIALITSPEYITNQLKDSK